VQCVISPPGRHNISNYQIEDHNRMSQIVLQSPKPRPGYIHTHTYVTHACCTHVTYTHMSHTQCYTHNVTHTILHTHVTHTMLHTQCYTHNVTHTMLHTQCYTHMLHTHVAHTCYTHMLHTHVAHTCCTHGTRYFCIFFFVDNLFRILIPLSGVNVRQMVPFD
jgi:hypothetical protein